MRAALDIAIKDLRQKVRDRSALLIAIVAPFVLAVLFSVMLGDVDQGFDADWGVVDLDGGEVAMALVEGPLAGMAEAEVVTITPYPDPDSARDAVDAGEIQTAIIIPAGFSDAASSGAGATIEIVANPDATISTQVARSVLQGFIGRVDAVGVAVATALFEAGELPDDAVTAALAEQAQSMTDPIALVEAATADRNAPTSTYYAAAMAILFVFLGAQFGVVSLLTEKRMGTLARIVASPLRPFTVVIGKSIVSMVLAVVSLTVIIVGTSLMLGAEWGDPIAVAALVLAAALAATGVALAAVGFARTEDQASTLVAIVTITLAVLGGSFFPVSQGEGVLATLSLLTPHAWFIDGVEDISTGGDIVSAAGPIIVLLVIGLVGGAIGMWRARRVVVT